MDRETTSGQQLVGVRLGHYCVLEKIGAGGMGEVYRARDEHLQREVAIKVLPPGTLEDEPARKRFRKEALALSRLNHPTIATVFDFDTHERTDYLVTEYIPGASLDNMLASGPLPEGKIANFGIQLVEGLEAAHQQGVIHRDLKPGNIRITPDSRLKILDFGLARILRGEPVLTVATESVSETEAVSGTLPYMAPEQLRGLPADARTDLYAVGAVLYEMSTGLLPFRQKVPASLADEILHQSPVPPLRLNPEISPRLEEIILKCLEKEPGDRYQSARELLVDLRRLLSRETLPALPRRARHAPPWRTALLGIVFVALLGVGGYFAARHRWKTAQPIGKVMLAVLPVDNLSRDPEQEYFSDGLTEEMIARLGSLQPKRLGVIARTSAMRYKKTDKSIPQIASELGVDYILESSVRRNGGRVRITVQLIQVSDQTHLWAESYERDVADVLGLQSDVSQRVARSLAVELLPAQQARLTSPRPVNPEAYDLYLKGRYHWNRRTPADLREAADYFQKATELDPTYALAYAGLADSYALYSFYGVLPPRESFPLARAAAAKALEIDNTLIEARTSMAFITFYYDWDWAAADAQLRQILEQRPDYAIARQWHAEYLSAMGRYEEALAEIKQAQESDPLSPVHRTMSAYVHLYGHRYAESIEACRRALALNPDFSLSYTYMGRSYAAQGAYREAEDAFKRALELGAPQEIQILELARVYAQSGRRLEATRLLRQGGKAYQSPTYAASVQAALGDTDGAMVSLEKAYRDREPYLLRAKVDPQFDALRRDPRFQDLLRRMNLPE